MDTKQQARKWFMKGYQYDVVDEQYEKAIDAYKECIMLDDKMADAYTNMGFIHIQREDYEEALECFQRSLDHRESAGDPATEASILCKMGQASSEQENWPSACCYFQRAVDIWESLGDVGEAGAVSR